MYVRYEAVKKNSCGIVPGVFALANGLARSGALSDEDYAWWRANNDWMNGAYSDPGSVDAKLFDRGIHPHTQCWFKLGGVAEHLLLRTRGYLGLLDRYGVRWIERRSGTPGPILYEDEYQIVVERTESSKQAQLVHDAALIDPSAPQLGLSTSCQGTDCVLWVVTFRPGGR